MTAFRYSLPAFKSRTFSLVSGPAKRTLAGNQVNDFLSQAAPISLVLAIRSLTRGQRLTITTGEGTMELRRIK